MRALTRSALLCAVALLTLLVAVPGAHAASKTVEQRNIVFAKRAGVNLRLDIARPANAKGAPIVLLLHGGGWWYGTRRDLMDDAGVANRRRSPVAQTFVDAGFITVGIDYRLACGTKAAPRKRWGESFNRNITMCGAYIPDQVADVLDAVRFARANAASWGGDPERITLLGASAGGHLALLAAASAPVDARVSAVANWSGPSSNRFIASQNPRRKPTINPSFTNAVGCIFSSRTCKARWDAASPYAQLTPRTPKFAVLAVSGIRETQVPASTHRQFDVKLRRLGFASRVVALPSACHGAGCRRSLVRTSRGYRSMQALTIAFLRDHS